MPPPHHGHHHPAHLHTPKKSLPGDEPPSNLQAKVVVLAKVNLGITLIPVTGFAVLLLVFYARDDLFTEYAKSYNQSYVGENLQKFLAQEKSKQWSNLLIQFGWCAAETVMAYVLLHGSKNRDYGYMKAWLILMTAAFFAEVTTQLMGISASGVSLADVPIVMLATFAVADVYRLVCIFVVYLLVDEMVERGEVKASPDRDSNYELE